MFFFSKILLVLIAFSACFLHLVCDLFLFIYFSFHHCQVWQEWSLVVDLVCQIFIVVLRCRQYFQDEHLSPKFSVALTKKFGRLLCCWYSKYANVFTFKNCISDHLNKLDLKDLYYVSSTLKKLRYCLDLYNSDVCYFAYMIKCFPLFVCCFFCSWSMIKHDFFSWSSIIQEHIQ